MYRIAIQPDEISLPRGRGQQSFSRRWVQRLRDMGHEPVIVDANQDDFFEQVAACDGFMWTIVHATYSRHFGRRVLAALEHATKAMDGIYRDGKPVIVEISYIYDSWLVEACPGHWKLDGNPEDGHLEWVEERMWPEDAILDDFLTLIARGRRRVERQPVQPWPMPLTASS